MAEVITETILPGTYIEVRAEGLLSVGAIATGNVGVIGTAEMGDPGHTEILSQYADGSARYGSPGAWDTTVNAQNLTLARGLRLLFDNGARTVYARRIIAPDAAEAVLTLGASGAGQLTLRARSKGSGGNRLQVRVEDVDAAEIVQAEEPVLVGGTYTLTAQPGAPTPAAPAGGNGGGAPAAAAPTLGTVYLTENRMTSRLRLAEDPATAQSVQVNTQARTLAFGRPLAADAEVSVSYWTPATRLRKVTLRFGARQEQYTVPSLAYLRQRINDPLNGSKLVTADAPANLAALSNVLPPTTEGRFVAFAGGVNGAFTPGTMKAAIQDALDILATENLQIMVVLAPFSSIIAPVLGHLEFTENRNHERIAVVGADSSDLDKVLENANGVADKRVVLVAPGCREQDDDTGQWVDLPAYLTAAAVAGKIASLAPHISLTNKTLASISELSQNYGYGEQTNLVQNRVLIIEKKNGIRTVKGLTTDDGAFRQISIRRIVDYAKEGTRMGANQYIGRLNNRRVREALRTTLDGFLADMLLREFLTGYTLDVSATRAQEIAGEVLVTMELRPTFSIDVVRVIMNLA